MDTKSERGERPAAAGILTLLVLVFLVVMMALSVKRVSVPLERFLKRECDFAQFTKDVKNAYTADSRTKNELINLNGLFSRTLGQRLNNNVIRLNNGMLTYPEYAQNVTPVAENLIEFDRFLAERGTPFLYVQAPYKLDLSGELLPMGMTHHANENADKLLALLREGGVATYDLRPMFSATPELVEESFYRTDHHWTCTSALRATRPILEEVDALLPEKSLDMTYADPDQWEAHTSPALFLGSQGKRVGIYYGGVDDMTYYTPKFDARMSCEVSMNHYRFTQGDYGETILRMENMERDYFTLSPYCVNIGGDYPLVRHRNAGAPNRMKVLLIKDSFSLPLQAYFSTLFQEVDVVDPRHMKACTVAQYVTMSQPDVVIMMINPDQYISKGYDSFGAAEAAAWEKKPKKTETVVEKTDVEISAGENLYSYAVIGETLEHGKRYTLRFDDVELLEGSTASVTALVYNASTDAGFNYGLFDLEYDKEKGYSWSFFTPQEGEDQFRLLLYAGIPGETAGMRLRYKGVSLTAEGE